MLHHHRPRVRDHPGPRAATRSARRVGRSTAARGRLRELVAANRREVEDRGREAFTAPIEAFCPAKSSNRAAPRRAHVIRNLSGGGGSSSPAISTMRPAH
jgi:hypothetical protein